ncbi:unnamed protein product, partial [Mesorhabditis belari]|uniref:Aminopeptidase P N-terminal domain-containing protein n=1 Tax=Mesorhabditis belari TaxID=2138241 RepID=A0AAF3F0P1_9BILA
MTQCALVTGAVSPLGRAIVERLGFLGYRVAAADSKSLLDGVENRFRKPGREVIPVEVDLNRPDHRQKLFEKVASSIGQIDSLIVVPGQNQFHGAGTIVETCAGALDKTFTQFVTTPFRIVQQGLPYLAKSKNGSIVFFGSIAGFQPMLDIGVYSVASSAVLALTKAVAESGAQSGVRVNAVISGMIDGDGSSAVWDSNRRDLGEDEQRKAEAHESISQMIPLGRPGKPKDVANAVEFLISPRAKNFMLIRRFSSTACRLLTERKVWANQPQKIPDQEFATRRERLIEKIRRDHPQAKEKDVLIVLKGARKYYTGPDVAGTYRQCSNFRYLSGVTSPDAFYTIHASKENKIDSLLFLRKRTAHEELWDGPSLSDDELGKTSGCEEIVSVEQFPKRLEKMVSGAFLCYDLESDWSSDVKALFTGGASMTPLRRELHKLRVVKSSTELACMSHVCTLGAQMMTAMIAESREVTNENEIRGRLEFEARKRGAENLAYMPVIAGGARANVIHYMDNNASLHNGDTVLVDAGCDAEGYVSDITRCFPVSGEWSDSQRVLYEALNLVQTNLLVYANSVEQISLSNLFQKMIEFLAAAMTDAGVLPDGLSGQELAKEAQLLCPHHVSHYLGMDVHDCETMEKHIPVQPGTVFTIEPGVYVQATNRVVPKEFRGIGYRIEDDVVKTESGICVLTESCQRDTASIVALMGK